MHCAHLTVMTANAHMGGALLQPVYLVDWFQSCSIGRNIPCLLHLFLIWPCCMACWILVPQPGTEPMSPALAADSLPLSHHGSPLCNRYKSTIKTMSSQNSWGYKIWSCKLLSSVAQSCPTLCDPVDCSMPGFPVHQQLLELAQTPVWLLWSTKVLVDFFQSDSDLSHWLALELNFLFKG